MTRFSAAASERGVTLLETMMVITISTIVASAAMFQVATSLPSMKASSGSRAVLSEFNLAREYAQSQRRLMNIQFVGTNQMQIVRQNVPNGTTVVHTLIFEGGMTYQLTTGLPDTPDAFGKHGAIDFGTANTISFTPDGMLVDERGVPVNGTVFLGINGNRKAARAVTVFGATGRIRGYRWISSTWEK